MRVLVVDDSKTIRSSVQRILHPRGAMVLTASDGFAALCVVERQPPDIILLDLMMPRLDGYQTCALLKRHPVFNRIPVVMLSSKDGVFDRARWRMEMFIFFCCVSAFSFFSFRIIFSCCTLGNTVALTASSCMPVRLQPLRA